MLLLVAHLFFGREVQTCADISPFTTGMGKRKPMTSNDASRIQSAQARAGNGGVDKGSFAARAQRAAAMNTNRAEGATTGDPDKSDNARNSLTSATVGLLGFAALAFAAAAVAGCNTSIKGEAMQRFYRPSLAPKQRQRSVSRTSMAILFLVLVWAIWFSFFIKMRESK